MLHDMNANLKPIEQASMGLSSDERARFTHRMRERVTGKVACDVVMTPVLERLLDEGSENLAKHGRRMKFLRLFEIQRFLKPGDNSYSSLAGNTSHRCCEAVAFFLHKIFAHYRRRAALSRVAMYQDGWVLGG